jgi:hypothetical protein
MRSHRCFHSRARWLGLALALAASAGHAQSGDSATTSRFSLRSVQTAPMPNASQSGRFGVVAQAQARFVNAAGKRFAVLGAAQCEAGVPTPGRIFANGFE